MKSPNLIIGSALTRLAYISTLEPGTTAEQLDKLISAAAEKNARLGITGTIAFDGERVCQILEGPPDVVDQIFSVIRADSRHFNVSELDRSEVDKRHFADWGMTRRPMVDMVMLAYSVLR